MARTPDEIAAVGTEAAIQNALLQAIAYNIYPQHPEAELIYHIPNGGARGRTRAEAQRAGAQMTALGVKKGMPDLCLPVGRHGFRALYIELKNPKDSGHLSLEQLDRIMRLSLSGNFCAIVDSWQDGFDLVNAYFNAETQYFYNFFATSMLALARFQPDAVRIYDKKGYAQKSASYSKLTANTPRSGRF